MNDSESNSESEINYINHESDNSDKRNKSFEHYLNTVQLMYNVFICCRVDLRGRSRRIYYLGPCGTIGAITRWSMPRVEADAA